MNGTIAVDPAKCNACKLCELACSLKHTGEYNPAQSRIRMVVFADEAFYFPVTCLQCQEAFCAAVCPTRALTRNNATGVVELAEHRCVGCKMCTVACPFGAIACSDATGKAFKCDLCGGAPECVTFCLPGALEYRDTEMAPASKARALANKMLQAYKEVAAS